ncbi:uncharacterized protein A1O9_07113 [Exophiala aquamarina CBS 119918]|uniref:Uncharacterized protein n=1 Tax=Exophiala aquamarina CBS 119918 TaxID=1182545 RepID=A0A072PCA6_9EURO|nr:uncharacterized protein A1O9_07113 [Exophiala aquamarina CBS 119918]KEF56923.1 hypothetical protein A1O9_07113 [Exophiala aquamarina CBS 119918]
MELSTHTAAVLEGIGQSIILKALPIPSPAPGSATVRVLATTVSPNSRAVFAGKFGPVTIRTPVTPSGPAIARIHNIGVDATFLQPGQLVFTDLWTRSRDDPDESILAGYIGGNQKLEAAWEHGTFAEYANVPLERIWPLNESRVCKAMNYSSEELVHLGTISIAIAGLMDINVLPTDTVIVAPATGTFSGAAVHAALAMGASVIACGRNEEALAHITNTFESSGCLSTVKLTGDAPGDTAAIKAITGKKGADKYIDFIPPQAAGSEHITSCISALRPHGKAVFMGAVFSNLEIPYTLIMRHNLTVQGRYMFDYHHAEYAIKLLETGRLILGDRPNSGLKIHTFKLQDIEKAIDAAATTCRGWGNSVVLKP